MQQVSNRPLSSTKLTIIITTTFKTAPIGASEPKRRKKKYSNNNNCCCCCCCYVRCSKNFAIVFDDNRGLIDNKVDNEPLHFGSDFGIVPWDNRSTSLRSWRAACRRRLKSKRESIKKLKDSSEGTNAMRGESSNYYCSVSFFLLSM